MKKAGNLIMIILLVTATGGLSITRHYCGQSLKSYSIYSTPEPCCEKGCDKCHNESSFNKITDEFTGTSFASDLHIVPDHPVQTLLGDDISGSLNNVSFISSYSSKKFLYPEAGVIPVNCGNLRC